MLAKENNSRLYGGQFRVKRKPVAGQNDNYRSKEGEQENCRSKGQQLRVKKRTTADQKKVNCMSEDGLRSKGGQLHVK